MKRLRELTVAGVCVTSMAASMSVTLAARAQDTIHQISAQEVAKALKQSGIQPMTGAMASRMLTVPVDRHNVIGQKPKPIKNPYAGDKQAWADGKKLYKTLNCAVCHGLKGGGGQGEQLNNGQWRYGGKPADLYLSISHGRPKGMPAWGNALPPEAIWWLVTYVETLPSNHPNHPHKTPISLENKSRQAPIIRTAPPKSSSSSGGSHP